MNEVEAKFFVRDLRDVRQRVRALGGQIRSNRQLERNWRFDDADRSLSKSGGVLRLRLEQTAQLTYKRPLQTIEERQEIELEIDSHSTARALLEELGFQAISSYEKYRETHAFGETLVMLDELPFGDFVEIEGPSLQEVEQHARRLGLDWNRRVRRSYLDLFDQIRARLELPGSEASFQAFRHLPAIDPQQLELEDALVDAELKS